MVFISIPIFVFIILCSIGSVTGIGVVAYQVLIASHHKESAEFLFFVSICTIILIIVCLGSIIFYSKRKNNVLKRITKTARVNGIVAVQRFSEFGKLGTQMQTLFEDILNVSEKRAHKIVYLDNMVRSIFNSMQKSAIVVDKEGVIQYFSNGYRKTMDSKEKNILGVHIANIYPELSFDEITKHIEKAHSDYNIKTEESSFDFFPIFSSNNTLAGLYIVTKKNNIISTGTDAVKQIYDNITKPVIMEKESDTDTHVEETILTKHKKNFFDFFRSNK